MTEDINWPLLELRNRTRRSLVANLCDVQNCVRNEEKDRQWYDSLQCLQAVNFNDRLQLNDISPHNPVVLRWLPVRGDYALRSTVVISWRWTDEPKQGNLAKFVVQDDGSAASRGSRVDDQTLFRILRYVHLQDPHCQALWIDRDCIDQNSDEAKSRAMQSMDLVYRFGAQSLALLTWPIQKRHELTLLSTLLRGKWVVKTKFTKIWKLRRYVTVKMARRMISLLEHLVSNEWWHRAWTYQEELCAGHKMSLLIPVSDNIHRSSVYAEKQGHVPGEIEIGAVEFRQKLSLFCVAHLRKQGSRWHNGTHRCQALLKLASSHLIIEKARSMVGECERRSFSLSVLDDISSRQITKKWDVLPILANCSAYSIRLDEKKLTERGCHLNASIVAQALLNGELIDNSIPIDGRPDMTAPQLLSKLMFAKFDVPVKKMQFTFIKRCRCPDVTLVPLGVRTRGRVWRIHERIRVSREGVTSTRGALNQLAASIRPRHSKLAVALDGLNLPRKRDKGNAKVNWESSMARYLLTAIRTFRSLCVAAPLGESECCGVFVVDDDSVCHILTARHDVNRSSGMTADRYVEKRLSLTVDVEATDDAGTPHLRTRDWVNGLEFSEPSAQVDILLPWPDGFERL